MLRIEPLPSSDRPCVTFVGRGPLRVLRVKPEDLVVRLVRQAGLDGGAEKPAALLDHRSSVAPARELDGVSEVVIDTDAHGTLLADFSNRSARMVLASVQSAAWEEDVVARPHQGDLSR